MYRLSGTGTSGASLRVYLDRYEPADGYLAMDPTSALADLVEAAKELSQLEPITGRTDADVGT